MTALERERERGISTEYSYEEYIRLNDEGVLSEDIHCEASCKDPGWAEFYNNKSGVELEFTPLDYLQWTFWQSYKFDIKKKGSNSEEKPGISVVDSETKESFPLEDFIQKQCNISVADITVMWFSANKL